RRLRRRRPLPRRTRKARRSPPPRRRPRRKRKKTDRRLGETFERPEPWFGPFSFRIIELWCECDGFLEVLLVKNFSPKEEKPVARTRRYLYPRASQDAQRTCRWPIAGLCNDGKRPFWITPDSERAGSEKGCLRCSLPSRAAVPVRAFPPNPPPLPCRPESPSLAASRVCVLCRRQRSCRQSAAACRPRSRDTLPPQRFPLPALWSMSISSPIISRSLPARCPTRVSITR